MQQNATLPPDQEIAIDALISGSTITAAAAAAGIDRSTLHRWLKDDFAFQAEINRRRNDLRQHLQDRLTSLCGHAVGCVQDAIEAGDVRSAVSLLKGLGILDTPTIGSMNRNMLEGERMNENMAAAVRQTSFY